MGSRRSNLAIAALGLGTAALLALVATTTRGTAPAEPVPQRAVPASRPGKPPIENLLDEEAEERNSAARKAWFAERRRAPPGTDVQAIEKRNGLAQIARRNALAGRPRAERMAYGASWQERGSDNQAGRMHVTAFNADRSAMYAGSSLGGIWRSDLDGDGWTPLGDNLWGGAHWLEILPGPGGDVILAATDGGMVHRSTDGGATWTAPGGLPPDLFWIRRLESSTDGTNTVYLLAGGWSNGTQRYRLLRSRDAGASFEEIRDLGPYAGDAFVPRDGSRELYLLEDDDLLASEDQGDTWAKVGTVPGAAGTAGELTGSEAGAPTFYAAVDGEERTELHRSDDGGATWVHVQDPEDYWDVLIASSVDPNLVAWGGVELHVSRDGGLGFEVRNVWYAYYDDPENQLHADMMGVDVFPDGQGGETWYVATDGGLYRSNDGLLAVSNLSLRGLRVSQYYSTLTDVSDPSRVAAGAQDQGYQLTTGIAQTADVWDFEQIISGDYGHLTSNDGTHETVFSVYPGTILVHLGAYDDALLWLEFPEQGARAWLPPVVAFPARRSQDFFWAGEQLWRFENTQQGVWEPEVWSPELELSAGEYISALAFSPVEPDRAWLATSSGGLYRSLDQGKTWKVSDDDGPDSHYLYGTALLPSLTDPELVYVGGSGYGNPGVLRSRNGGRRWEAFDDGLPATMIYALCEAPDGSGILLAGTEQSVYRRDPGSKEWVDVTGADAPITIYWSCEALQHENTIRFGTYGRGIWDYQLDPLGLGCFPPRDDDGDGYLCDVDCADDDEAVHPDAADPCDGVDQDCDPATPVETDANGDGLIDCAEPLSFRPPAGGCATADGAGRAIWMAALLALVRRRR